MATMKEVAKEAGVSVATVSAVVNSNSKINVSDNLRFKVKKAVEKLNYHPNGIARALSNNKTSSLAYVIPSISNDFFSQLANYIEEIAFDNGYTVYICNTNSNVKRVKLYTKHLIESRVDGVLTTLTWEVINSGLVQSFINENIPIVGIAGARVPEEIDTVTYDDIIGSEMATNYLFKNGYNNIGFIGAVNSMTTKYRFEGYCNVHKKHGVPIKNKYIFGKGFSREDGFILAEKIINQYSSLSGLLVYNDVMASGVIDKFNIMGIEIPERVAVIGYDDSIANHTMPKMTTVALPKKEMAEIAMEMLFSRINKINKNIQHIKVTPNLVVRGSA